MKHVLDFSHDRHEVTILQSSSFFANWHQSNDFVKRSKETWFIVYCLFCRWSFNEEFLHTFLRSYFSNVKEDKLFAKLNILRFQNVTRQRINFLWAYNIAEGNFFASCLFTSTITNTLHFILKDKLKSRQACMKMYIISNIESLPSMINYCT